MLLFLTRDYSKQTAKQNTNRNFLCGYGLGLGVLVISCMKGLVGRFLRMAHRGTQGGWSLVSEDGGGSGRVIIAGGGKRGGLSFNR